MKNLNPWHVLSAREAFEKALLEAGFWRELRSFAREHPAPAFLLDEARRDSSDYARAMRAFCTQWGLTAEWFLGYCHDVSWAFHHSKPRRIYFHPLPPTFGLVTMTIDPTEPPFSEGGAAAEDAGSLWREAFWLEDTRPLLRQRILRAAKQALENLLAPARVRLAFEVISVPPLAPRSSHPDESVSAEIGLPDQSLPDARERHSLSALVRSS